MERIRGKCEVSSRYHSKRTVELARPTTLFQFFKKKRNQKKRQTTTQLAVKDVIGEVDMVDMRCKIKSGASI